MEYFAFISVFASLAFENKLLTPLAIARNSGSGMMVQSLALTTGIEATSMCSSAPRVFIMANGIR